MPEYSYIVCHEQLMAQNKAYAALFNKQQELEHFREEAV